MEVSNNKESDVLDIIAEISSFIDEYEKAYEKAEVIQFSKYDPNENLKHGLAEYLSSKSQRGKQNP